MKRKFSLIELLVVIAIISILMSMLLPVLKSVKESGHSTSCLNNLKQMGAANMMYAQDYDDFLTRTLAPSLWILELRTYLTIDSNPVKVPNPAIFTCPSQSKAWVDGWYYPSYGGNCHLLVYSWATGPDPGASNPDPGYTKLSKVASPSQKIMMGDSLNPTEGGEGVTLLRNFTVANRIPARHKGCGNVLFVGTNTDHIPEVKLQQMQINTADTKKYIYPYIK